MKSIIAKQSSSDAEADTEKSNTEDTNVIYERRKKRKRKFFRKRKRPQKRPSNIDSAVDPAQPQSDSAIQPTSNSGGEEGASSDKSKDPANSEMLLEVVSKNTDSSPRISRRESRSSFAQALKKRDLEAGRKKYMSLVHGTESMDSSHDDDSDDIVGVVAAEEGGPVFTDLATLVHTNCSSFHATVIDDLLSDDEGSYSSRMSNKSEKNMADFEGEESGCEVELAELAARHLTAIQQMKAYHPHPALSVGRAICRQPMNRTQSVARLGAQFNLEQVCKPGNTLLWDLLQDDKITQLGEGLAIEAEKALCNLLCFNIDRLIPMKFIEGCLENLANNKSVVVSLRLLPKLLASFQQFGVMDTHAITTWADRERGMMKHFFNNLKTYTIGNTRNGLYSHQTEVQVRLQFLSSIFSPLGSPDGFR